jgi:plasmid stability protein
MDLVLHDVEEQLLQALKLSAEENHVSVEEEHRRILLEGLKFSAVKEGQSYDRLKDLLISGPRIPDEYLHYFERSREMPRDIDFR